MINNLFKVYFQLNNLRLCQNLIRAVEGPGFPKVRHAAMGTSEIGEGANPRLPCVTGAGRAVSRWQELPRVSTRELQVLRRPVVSTQLAVLTGREGGVRTMSH